MKVGTILADFNSFIDLLIRKSKRLDETIKTYFSMVADKSSCHAVLFFNDMDLISYSS